MNSIIYYLPPEIWQNIFFNVDPFESVSVAAVCKYFKIIMYESNLKYLRVPLKTKEEDIPDLLNTSSITPKIIHTLKHHLNYHYFQRSSYHQKIIEVFKNLAGTGNSDAQYCLGLHYTGEWDTVEKDMDKAALLFKQSSEQNNAYGQNALGYIYGLSGNSMDMKKAFQLYQLSANQGNDGGLANLGMCYKIGDVVDKDVDEALRLFKLSAKLGNSGGQQGLALEFQSSNNHKDHQYILPLYLSSIYQNNETGMNNLAHLMLHGVHGIEKDVTKAIKLLNLSAEKGNTTAIDNLGVIYSTGIDGFIERDISKAIHYYQVASDLNFTKSIIRLGKIYEDGVYGSIQADPVKAFELYQKAANLCDIYGYYHLARCYQNGKGCTINLFEAYKYFQKAAEHGHKKAQTELNRFTINYHFV